VNNLLDVSRLLRDGAATRLYTWPARMLPKIFSLSGILLSRMGMGYGYSPRTTSRAEPSDKYSDAMPSKEELPCHE
jgi:hypothetical protein